MVDAYESRDTVAADGRSATLTLEGKTAASQVHLRQRATAVFTDAPALPLAVSPHPAQQILQRRGAKAADPVFLQPADTTLAVQFSPDPDGFRAHADHSARIAARAGGSFACHGSPRERLRGAGVSPRPSSSTPPGGTRRRRFRPWRLQNARHRHQYSAREYPGIASTTITEPGKSPSTYSRLHRQGAHRVHVGDGHQTTAGNPALTSTATRRRTGPRGWTIRSPIPCLRRARSVAGHRLARQLVETHEV